MKEMFGNPPVLSLRGCQADIVSSSNFITEASFQIVIDPLYQWHLRGL